MNQFDLFASGAQAESAITSDKPRVYQNMDRARAEFGHLIGLPATWTRLVKHSPSDPGRRGEDGLVTKEIPGSGYVIGFSGGLDAYSPRLIIHECDCCKAYDPKAVCAHGKGTWWLEPERVTVRSAGGAE